MRPLARDEIQSRLPQGWRIGQCSIVRELTFSSYMDGIRFVNDVAELAEREDHHPDITIIWRTIKLSLSTHSVGGVTERDIDMANKINSLVEKWASKLEKQ